MGYLAFLLGKNRRIGIVQFRIRLNDVLACGTGHFQGFKVGTLIHISTEIFPETQFLITLSTERHTQCDVELLMGGAKAVQLDFQHCCTHGAAFGDKDGAGAEVGGDIVPGRVIELAGAVEGVDFPGTAVEAPGGGEGFEDLYESWYSHDQKSETHKPCSSKQLIYQMGMLVENNDAQTNNRGQYYAKHPCRKPSPILLLLGGFEV